MNSNEITVIIVPFNNTGKQEVTGNNQDAPLQWTGQLFDSLYIDNEIVFISTNSDKAVPSPVRHRETGDVSAALSNELEESSGQVFICSSDAVFEAAVVDSLVRDATSAAVGVDVANSSMDDLSQTVGLAKFDRESAKMIAENQLRTRSFVEFLESAIAAGVNLHTIEVDGTNGRLTPSESTHDRLLTTKADTLRHLSDIVEQCSVPPLTVFSVGEWQTDPRTVLNQVHSTFETSRLAVRSSSRREDRDGESAAGRYQSVLDVEPTDQALRDAIETVIGSYDEYDKRDQVIVQSMVKNVEQSGVVMSRTVEPGGPYYVIDYVPSTEDTDVVTSGSGAGIQTLVVSRCGHDSDEDLLEEIDAEVPARSVLQVVREVESLLDHDALDLEFAVDDSGNVHLLQVRPMTAFTSSEAPTDKTVFDTIRSCQSQFESNQSSVPGLDGDRTYYGVMPDWNPAEMIGRRPKKLARTLYEYLITDDIWARQRCEFGYRDVRPAPLIRTFAGQPYVDLRVDFASFIPASLPDHLAQRLIECYLDTLQANPEAHDKVEFEIAITCLPVDFDARASSLLNYGFTPSELNTLEQCLRQITQKAFNIPAQQRDRIEKLRQRRCEVKDSNLPPLVRARRLLEDCRRFGTLPFAHLARAAFVATELLQSLRRANVLTDPQVREFESTITTVPERLKRDCNRVSSGEWSFDRLVDEYGHLRPGTYDITSLPYSERPGRYLRPLVNKSNFEPTDSELTELWHKSTRSDVGEALSEAGLPSDVNKFLKFLQNSIEGRESSKFEFTRNLSYALESIVEFGRKYGFSREDLSHVDTHSLLDAAKEGNRQAVASHLRDQSQNNKILHQQNRSVELPPVLFDATDFYTFKRPDREPTYISDECVTAKTVDIDMGEPEPPKLAGKIVFAEQADPGYDWLFGCDIAGLVTKYGGINSHMAVRAAEFNLPTVVGTGERRFEQLRRADILDLNCAAEIVEVIR